MWHCRACLRLCSSGYHADPKRAPQGGRYSGNTPIYRSITNSSKDSHFSVILEPLRRTMAWPQMSILLPDGAMSSSGSQGWTS